MKWAIREAVDVYFKAKSNFKLGARNIRAGEPVLIFDTVKTGTLDVAAATSYVTGGRGNVRHLAYEGDKTLGFQFEEALLSAEAMAILSGAELIPARNKNLPGASKEARSVIAHFTEKIQIDVANNTDSLDENNKYPASAPRGGLENIWLTRKPFVGKNSEIYVMLLDKAGEISGSPIQINLANKFKTGDDAAEFGRKSYIAQWEAGDKFIAFDKAGMPIATSAAGLAEGLKAFPNPSDRKENAVFDDIVAHYVDIENLTQDVSATESAVVLEGIGAWNDAWGDVNDFIRTISAEAYIDMNSFTAGKNYGYLLAPSSDLAAQPKAFLVGSQFVYKLNVPSILFGDIVLVDYYVEYRHNAVQVSILPDKFAPYMYVEGSSLVRRASDGVDLPVEFVIPKLKITTALNFTLQSSGDPSTFNFEGDAYPDFTKFDMTKKVLADIQILDADDNYDGGAVGEFTDPTSYRRYKYNDNDGEYVWKDPSIAAHGNIDYADAYDYQETNLEDAYSPSVGGPATRTPGAGVIDVD